MALLVGPGVPGVTPRPVLQAAWAVVVAAALVTVPLARLPAQTLVPACRPRTPALVLVATASAAVVVALARPCPVPVAPVLLAMTATVGVPIGGAILVPTTVPATLVVPGVGLPVPVVAIAGAAVVKTATRALAGGLAAPIPLPMEAATVVVAPLVLVAALDVALAPSIRQTGADGLGDIPVAMAVLPPTRPVAAVGLVAILLVAVGPRPGGRPRPVRLAVLRRLAPTPVAPAPRQVGLAVGGRAVGLADATVPRAETAGGVPLRRPIALGLSAVATQATRPDT